MYAFVKQCTAKNRINRCFVSCFYLNLRFDMYIMYLQCFSSYVSLYNFCQYAKKTKGALENKDKNHLFWMFWLFVIFINTPLGKTSSSAVE